MERARRAGELLWSGVSRFAAAGGNRDAAQLAFFILLAFPPLLVLVVWLFTATLDPQGKDDVIDSILRVVPLSADEGAAEVRQLLDGAAAGAAGLSVLVVAVLVYSASGAMGALRHAINAAFDTPEVRPLVPSKALDVSLVLGAAPLLTAAGALNVVRAIPVTLSDQTLLAGVAEVLLIDVLPLVIVFGVLLVLFRILPAAHRSWRAAWPGALVATLVLQLVQVLARFYFAEVSDAEVIYGTLGVLLAVVLSIYMDALAVVFGAHVAGAAALVRPDPRAGQEALALTGDAAPPGAAAQVLAWLKGLVVRPPR